MTLLTSEAMVRRAIEELGPMTVDEIVDVLRIGDQRVRRAAKKLQSEGVLVYEQVPSRSPNGEGRPRKRYALARQQTIGAVRP